MHLSLRGHVDFGSIIAAHGDDFLYPELRYLLIIDLAETIIVLYGSNTLHFHESVVAVSRIERAELDIDVINL